MRIRERGRQHSFEIYPFLKSPCLPMPPFSSQGAPVFNLWSCLIKHGGGVVLGGDSLVRGLALEDLALDGLVGLNSVVVRLYKEHREKRDVNIYLVVFALTPQSSRSTRSRTIYTKHFAHKRSGSLHSIAPAPVALTALDSASPHGGHAADMREVAANMLVCWHGPVLKARRPAPQASVQSPVNRTSVLNSQSPQTRVRPDHASSSTGLGAHNSRPAVLCRPRKDVLCCCTGGREGCRSALSPLAVCPSGAGSPALDQRSCEGPLGDCAMAQATGTSPSSNAPFKGLDHLLDTRTPVPYIPPSSRLTALKGCRAVNISASIEGSSEHGVHFIFLFVFVPTSWPFTYTAMLSELWNATLTSPLPKHMFRGALPDRSVTGPQFAHVSDVAQLVPTHVSPSMPSSSRFLSCTMSHGVVGKAVVSRI